VKTLLLTPPAPPRRLWGLFRRGAGAVPPLGLLCVAAAARAAGHEVEIFDAASSGASAEDLKRRLAAGRYEAVGIQCLTPTADLSFAAAAAARRALPGALVVLGGVHPTALPEQTLRECPEADAAVIGEGEGPFCELLRLRAAGASFSAAPGAAWRDGPSIRVNQRAPVVDDLDSLPPPAYDLLDLGRYEPHPTQYRRLPAFPLYASRGCAHACSFCSAGLVHGRRVRRKSAERLLGEADCLVRAAGARGLYIQDSSFLESADYAAAFCEKLISGRYSLSWTCNARAEQLTPELARLLRRAGCWQVNVGAESASDDTLLRAGKGCGFEAVRRAAAAAQGAGLQLFASFILGLPGEGPREVEETIEASRGLGAHTAIFYLPVPYPGTALREACRLEGGLREDAPWSDYSSAEVRSPVYVNPRLGLRKMRAYYRRAYYGFYSDSRTLARNLRSVASWEDLRYYWRSARALSGLLW
jgi:anaerobic magnesium-protoporphyrin IX monomethyl ester cyclase